MENLKARFPVLAHCSVVVLANRDYRYRMIVPKSDWVPILAEMAQEQTWSNFKNEAADFAEAKGAKYVDALHDVWAVMYRLQDK